MTTEIERSIQRICESDAKRQEVISLLRHKGKTAFSTCADVDVFLKWAKGIPQIKSDGLFMTICK